MVNTGCLQKCYQTTRLVLHNIYIGWHKVPGCPQSQAELFDQKLEPKQSQTEPSLDSDTTLLITQLLKAMILLQVSFPIQLNSKINNMIIC